MLENIEVLCHSSIRMNNENVIYIDPFRIDIEYNDADYIFITHDHYDHLSKEDIDKVRKEDSIIVLPLALHDKALEIGFKEENIVLVIPNNKYELSNIKFKTIPSYNTNKDFHPKDKNYVGYVIFINSISYYIAGDTDITEENKKVVCDVAFVPIGGTYTMTYKEAAKLVNIIKPKTVVPIHYGEIVGSKEDANKFVELLDDDIEVKILIK